MAQAERVTFFSDARHDAALPEANAVFWNRLIDHVEAEQGEPPLTILDIGCHSGGLLARLAAAYPSSRLLGIEPIASCRAIATNRLRDCGSEVEIGGLDLWTRIANRSVDLVVCHEVLYLEGDLLEFMARLARVMSSGGAAFVVLGCHAENPLWAIWKPQMEAQGHCVYDHAPFDILGAAARQGLIADVQPLRRSGWVTYNPLDTAFDYPDAATMFDHHYRHKLIFRIGHR